MTRQREHTPELAKNSMSPNSVNRTRLLAFSRGSSGSHNEAERKNREPGEVRHMVEAAAVAAALPEVINDFLIGLYSSQVGALRRCLYTPRHTMMWSLFISAFAFIVVAVRADGQVHLADSHGSRLLTPELDAYAEHLMKVFHAPGIAVTIVHPDGDAELRNWGISSEDGKPSTPETLHCIASDSKAFLSASIGILIDDYTQGRNVTPLPPGVKLAWETKAKDLLPDEWMLKDEWADSKVSLLDMLGHVTGLPRHEFSYSHQHSINELVHKLRYLRPAYELREKWVYNNQMYMTASYIVSKYSNQSYPSFVKERIFSPLNMSSSTFYPQEAHDSGKLAQTFSHEAGLYGNETRRIPYFLQSWDETAVGMIAGAGGVITSTKDLTSWLKVLLNKGTNPEYDRVIIPASALDVVTSGRFVTTRQGEYPDLSVDTYGAGWQRVSYQGHEVLYHGGSVPGFSSYVVLLPNDGLGIAVLSNGGSVHSALSSIYYRIIEDFLKLKHIDWEARFLNKSSPALGPQTTMCGSEAALPAPLSEVAGTYHNPGYGSIELCAWPATNTQCESVFADYAAVYLSFNDTVSTTLFAAWPRMWFSHLRLSYHNTTVFNVTVESLFPTGYGNDTTPFTVQMTEDTNNPFVEFKLVDGKSVGFGTWGLEGGPAERIPGQPEETSEAWFSKVL